MGTTTKNFLQIIRLLIFFLDIFLDFALCGKDLDNLKMPIVRAFSGFENSPGSKQEAEET